MSQTLHPREVAKAIRAAMENNTLLAQAFYSGVNGTSPTCVYRDKVGCRCAIGVALSPETLNYIDKFDAHDQTLDVLISKKIINPLSANDYHLLSNLQFYHDQWLQIGDSPLNDVKQKFLDYLERCEQEE